MKVVILCGGKGTRLKEETAFRPKPLVTVGKKPILWHIMKYYSHYGFKDFILCLGYLGEMIKQYFIQYDLMNNDLTISFDSRSEIQIHRKQDLDWQVTLADTGIEAMTGCRLKRIEKYIGDAADFMVTYGDGLCNVDLAELYHFHRSHGCLATVTGVRPLSRFGELAVQGDTVKTFSEKTQVTRGWINGGFFVFRREIFNYLTNQDDCVLEREPLEHLTMDSQLKVFKHRGFWHCMDTYRDMEQLNKLWQVGHAPWEVWKNESLAK
ncbi:glucose-1-phosphate cytidylyltransferase [Desulforamulus reducens MI-1]|uniref:Glucose-1-phosphate cytidylyltransferase n=1 Tax=Desulforamulus reducens (strain ATCC BAA-1160 / DSM 100696 / MI-1) TaxID=349161 RepID=A4J5R5_DESRM|nr:glucose-1-phosphate cytidylyltransferase [Desulforamulus reducens]ABO50418.1 glucose-1-phosphate cytidylyltransferase [Desulforamulus reducens MI-1]